MQLRPAILVYLLAGLPVMAETPPLRFGPFMSNNVSAISGLGTLESVLPNAAYTLELGWLEPISADSGGIFHQTRLETNVGFYASPYQIDVSTTFRVHPLSFFGMGLTYNRLLYLGTMVAFETEPPQSEWRPGEILRQAWGNGGQFGGADIFEFEGQLNFAWSRLHLNLVARTQMWDINVRSREYAYETHNDFLIRTQDHIYTLLTRFQVDLEPWSKVNLVLQDRMARTRHTGHFRRRWLAGISGLRFGKDTARQSRGLELLAGYYLDHPHRDRVAFPASFVVIADYHWNLRFASL